MKKQLFKRICLWLMLILCLPLGMSLFVGCTPDGGVTETDPDTTDCATVTDAPAESSDTDEPPTEDSTDGEQ